MTTLAAVAFLVWVPWSAANARPELAAPTISHSPRAFVTTNGDILAEHVMSVGTMRVLAISGHFTEVTTAAGVTRRAANLAVINEATGHLLWTLHSISDGGYIRALASAKGLLYVGGDFTSVNGRTRSHVAAFHAGSGTITPWSPTAHGNVEALAANKAVVFVAGNTGTVAALARKGGAVTWSEAVNGQVRALLRYPKAQALYVGGYFDSIGGFTNHGLIRLNAGNGTPDHSFTPRLTPNGQPGPRPTYNGENPFTLQIIGSTSPAELLVGSGGVQNYIRVMNASTGAPVWSRFTVGDVQGVAVVGDSVVGGYHRWRTNFGTHWPYFGAQLSIASGALTNWDPGLSGTQTEADNGGNGIQAMVYDARTHELFVGGGFTTFGASCDPDKATSCTGGSPLHSLAEYKVTP
ncbi:MAG: PQQ-binding-like beta-propeller repeat protein [Gordonia polyisoprenivorans]|nr:PQQ-binding-like beta-propeller repeat protein [Gordonia polyisoprenivorans]